MYNIKSEFDVGKPGSVSHVTKSNVYGFGIGHRAYDKVYLPHKKRENDPDCPGPGKYNLDMYNIGKHARKYSMYSRVKNIAGKYKYSIRLNFSFFYSEPLNINTKQNFPAPGEYGQGIEINRTGVYTLSTIQNSKAATWSPSKNRFNDDNRLTRDLPGPGFYQPDDQSMTSGRYLLS